MTSWPAERAARPHHRPGGPGGGLNEAAAVGRRRRRWVTVERVGGGVERVTVDRLVLGGLPGVVGRCRDFVRASLAERGWLEVAGAGQPAVVEDVLLMTSELVTNACVYAGGPVELIVSDAGPGRVRVDVVDASPRAPGIRPTAGPARPGGYGLRVVQRLASRWGSEPRSGGKAVWFEVERAEASR